MNTSERLTDTELDAMLDALTIMRNEYITGLNIADARIDLAHALAAVRELRARRAAEAAAPAPQDAGARLGALAVAWRDAARALRACDKSDRAIQLVKDNVEARDAFKDELSRQIEEHANG